MEDTILVCVTVQKECQRLILAGKRLAYLALYSEAALIYLLFCTVLTWLQHWAEKRLSSYGGTRA